MKLILAIPVAIVRAMADVIFGADELTDTMRMQQSKAQLLMIMGRTH